MLFDSVRSQIVWHIKSQFACYAIGLFFFLTGIFCGVSVMGRLPEQDALRLFTRLGWGRGSAFYPILFQFRDFLLLFFCGLHLSGIVPALFIEVFRGFTLGALLAYVYSHFGLPTALSIASSSFLFIVTSLWHFYKITNRTLVQRDEVAAFTGSTLFCCLLSAFSMLCFFWAL